MGVPGSILSELWVFLSVFFPQIKNKKGSKRLLSGLLVVFLRNFCWILYHFELFGSFYGGAKRGAHKRVPPQKKGTQALVLPRPLRHRHGVLAFVLLNFRVRAFFRLSFSWCFVFYHSYFCAAFCFSGVENSSKQCCPHHQPHINMYLTSHAARGLSLCIPSDCGTMECSASVEPKMMRPDGDGRGKRGLLLSGSEGKKWSVGCHR